MTNLGLLIKNDFHILIGKLRGKKQKHSNSAAVTLLFVGALAILAYYCYIAWIMFDGLGVLAEGKLCLFHACTTTVTVLILLGLMRSASSKKTSDADMLLSMPIKKRDIVISKTISRYAFDLFFVVLLFVPFWVIYQIKIKLDVSMILFGVLLTLILPFFSIGLSYIFDFLVSRVFNKMRFGEMMKSILLVIVFVAVMGLLLVKTSTYGMVTSLDGYFEERPISNIFLKTLYGPGVVDLIFVLLLTVLPLVVGLVMYACDFGKPRAAYMSKNKTLKFGGSKSPVKLFLKKELYHYATTTGYIINTIIGAIIMLVFGVFLAIKGPDGLSAMIGGFQIPQELMLGIIVLVMCGASATTYISASSISLEGKSMELLKASPVKPQDLFLAKSLFHVIIVEPFLIVSSLVIWISFKLSFIQFLIILIIPTLHVLIMAFGGTLINLWQPNFDWEDETKVVKNSLASLLAMVLGFVLVVALLLLNKFLVDLQFELLALVAGGVYLIILIAICVVLFTKGKKMFYKL